MTGPICVGDPDGVPESGVRPGLSFTEWLATPGAPPIRVSGKGFCIPSYFHDPAALLGPVREPVDWNPRDVAGDEEC